MGKCSGGVDECVNQLDICIFVDPASEIGFYCRLAGRAEYILWCEMVGRSGYGCLNFKL